MEIYTLRESNKYQKFFRKAIQVLEELDLEYCVIGGIALSFYDYHRSTTDLDILISVPGGLSELRVRLSTLGVKQVFGHRFSIPGFDFDFEFILSGEQLSPGNLVYPEPKGIREWNTREKCWIVNLEMLVTMKLYGFTYERKRLKDGADVQELLLANLDMKKEFLKWKFEDLRVEASWQDILERTLL